MEVVTEELIEGDAQGAVAEASFFGGFEDVAEVQVWCVDAHQGAAQVVPEEALRRLPEALGGVVAAALASQRVYAVVNAQRVYGECVRAE